MSMKEDRAREGKKARYRKMGFGPAMDRGDIDFKDKHPLTKKRLKNFKKKDDAPMSDERFYQQRKAQINKAGVSTKKMLTGGQAKIAAKAPPPNKLDEKDFAVLRAEKAKGRGMGLQDEKMKPGKVKPVKAALGLALGVLGAMGAKKLMKKKSKMEPGVTSAKLPINLVEEYKEKAMGKKIGGKVQKANLGLMFMKKAKDKGAKGLEFLSPLAMLKRVSGRKAGGVMKYKRGMGPGGLDLPVISSVKPAVHKTKKAQKTAVMKEQFNKQKSRMGKKPYSSMAEMREAKGFKPGESASEFNKRRMKLAGATKALKATRIGKIALGVGAAGVTAQQYLKSKMNKKKDVKKKMGGGMMQKPMGYSKGVSVKARGCKLGRTRPTKIT